MQRAGRLGSGHRHLPGGHLGGDGFGQAFFYHHHPARSVPAVEDFLDRYGAHRHRRRVRSINLPVLSLESDRDHAYQMLLAEIARARDEDAVEAVVLGYAGRPELAESLSAETGVTVIDGVIVAIKYRSFDTPVDLPKF